MTAIPRDVPELLARIAADPALATLLAEARAREDGDLTHDTDHLLRVALGTLARRLPSLELAGEPVRNGRIVLRGFDALPVRVA